MADFHHRVLALIRSGQLLNDKELDHVSSCAECEAAYEISRRKMLLPEVDGYPPIADSELQTLQPRLKQLLSGAKKIGQGATATVYQTQTGELAVKVQQENYSSDPQERCRFLNAGELNQAINSRYVVRVLEVGGREEGSRPYVLMDWGGQPLSNRLGCGPLNYRDAVKIVRDVALGLKDVGPDLVHRDIKPANILIDTKNTKWLARLADFGCAVQLKEDHHTLSLHGTPRYLSPEQLTPNKLKNPNTLDQRSDLWALGVVLYQCVTDRLPFRGETQLETELAILNYDPTRPRRWVPSIPWSLETIILHGLRKDRNQRYAEPDELIEDLEGFLSNENASPKHAQRESWLEYGYRKSRQYPGPAKLTAAIILTATILTPVATVGWYMKGHETTRANQAADQAAKDAKLARETAELMAELVRMWDSSSSFGNGGEKGKVTRLAELERQVADRFQDHPLNRAELQDAIGLVYLKLSRGNTLRAEKLFEAALEVYKAHFPDDLKTRKTMENLADTRLALGKMEDARTLLTEVLTKASSDPTSADTRRLGWKLARAELACGQTAEAIQRLDPLTAEARTGAGRGDSDELDALAVLGDAYLVKGQSKKAVELLKLARAGLEKLHGRADHPEVLEAEETLAVAFYENGLLHEAAELYQRVWQGYGKLYGWDSPLTALAEYDWSHACQECGEGASRVPIRFFSLADLEMIRTELTEVLGPESPAVHHLSTEVGRFRLSTGRKEDGEKAIRELESAYQGHVKTFRKDHPTTLRTGIHLALAYHACGRTVDANRLLKDLRGLAERVHGSTHPVTTGVLRASGKVLQESDPTEAANLLATHSAWAWISRAQPSFSTSFDKSVI